MGWHVAVKWLVGQWEQIKAKSGGNTIVLHSDNDPFIPLVDHQDVNESSCVSSSGATPATQPGRQVPPACHFFLDFFEPIVQAANEHAQRPPWDTS